MMNVFHDNLPVNGLMLIYKRGNNVSVHLFPVPYWLLQLTQCQCQLRMT